MSASLEKIVIRDKNISYIYEESHQLPIVSLQLVFTGLRDISENNLSGIGNFTASLLNEGTTISGDENFSEKLDERAIQLSASANDGSLSIHLDVLKENLNPAIDLLAELIKYPNFQENPFNRVKNQILSDILQKESDFDYLANIGLNALLFNGTPLSKPQIGTIEDIEKISLKDIENLYKSKIVLSNLLPIIGGDINKTEAENIIFKLASLLENGEQGFTQNFAVTSSKGSEKISKLDTKQAYIYFGSPLNLKFGDNENYKMEIAFFILGSSGFGSRLMEEVRVKSGLAYSVRASSSLSKSRSYFSGHLQTKTTNLIKAKNLVIKVIEDFIKNGATLEELDSAKKFILGSEPLRTESLSQRMQRAFSEYHMNKPLGYSKIKLENILKLSLDDLNKFITEHSEILDLSFFIITAETESE
jgi:predicted Zn-dependent peptidase